MENNIRQEIINSNIQVNTNQFKEINHLIFCRAITLFDKLEDLELSDKVEYHEKLEEVSKEFDFFEKHTEKEHHNMIDVYLYRTKIELRRGKIMKAKEYFV